MSQKSELAGLTRNPVASTLWPIPMSEPPETGVVIDQTYLPFTPTQLLEHFAPVARAGDPDRFLTYYLTSQRNRQEFNQSNLAEPAMRPDLRLVRLGQQMEKDERFWVVAALMAIYHNAPDRTVAFSELLSRCEGLQLPIGRFATWEEALGKHQELYFEANLPSPPRYRHYLGEHPNERTLAIPSLREAARTRGSRLEGATKVDAFLIAPDTGFTVLFEAKVLADISTGIEFDVLRNQMIRNIDVMLDRNDALRWPLNVRKPDTTCFVLLTPELFRENRESRLYGWLFDRYKSDPALLHKHLPHRNEADLATVPSRLGWLTWEDCDAAQPGSCPWLDKSVATQPASCAERASLALEASRVDRGAVTVQIRNNEIELRPQTPVGLTEIAEILGVKPGTARMWNRRRLLPEPRSTVSGAPAWWWRDIEEWAIASGRMDDKGNACGTNPRRRLIDYHG